MINKMPSSSAQDRQISVWFQKIQNGEIKLPRFQRPQAWDRSRIVSLLDTITQNLPLGVTLLLDVAEEQFVSRYIASAPETGGKVTEHLLDGQQRLTALWRSLHNNYDDAKYFLYLKKYDRYNTDKEDKEDSVFCTTRWKNKTGDLMPAWANTAVGCFQRGLIPMELFRPGDIASEYEAWVNEAMLPLKPISGSENIEQALMDWMMQSAEVKNIIRDFRETISHFNLPFLSLPVQTSRETALQVFINMNTNSKPLSQYDIIRAEIEDLSKVSLDDLQKQLHHNFPDVHHYFELPFLILATSALMQEKLPNNRGMWDMNKELLVSNWNQMSKGLGLMAEFMESQGVHDKNRLPTNAVLSVIASLYTFIPDSLDARGKCEILLRKYLWSSFFTDRYENSAASNAYADFLALKGIISKIKAGEEFNAQEVPVLNRTKYPLSTSDELVKVGWPKRENIRARGIMAVFTKLGALDFADGSPLSRNQLSQSKRHYHHVFPDALIKETELESFLALNCALITDKTNLNISAKDPYKYLVERYNWTSEEFVNSRLMSHLIPIEELKNGVYSDTVAENRKEKITKDFESFLRKRAQYVVNAVNLLAEGREIVASEIMNSKEVLA